MGPLHDRAPCGPGGEHFAVAIPSDVARIEGVVETVVARCAARDYPRRACALNVPVALTEALANAIVNGNGEDAAKRVEVSGCVDDRELVIEVHDEGPGDPFAKVPELSRRARGVPVWAALRSLGRSGVADLVDGLAANARALADGIGAIEGAEIVNDVVFTQVCVAFGDDERTRAVIDRVLADGTAWMSGSRWRDRAVLRISVSNWSTDADDVAASVASVRRAAGIR